jgi:hypothetical protein
VLHSAALAQVAATVKLAPLSQRRNCPFAQARSPLAQAAGRQPPPPLMSQKSAPQSRGAKLTPSRQADSRFPWHVGTHGAQSAPAAACSQCPWLAHSALCSTTLFDAHLTRRLPTQ